MEFAASTLAQICEVIDEGGDLDGALLSRFSSARSDLVASVDRRICFLRFCEDAISGAKRARDAYVERARQLERMVEALKTKTMQAMKENEDVPFVGSLGRFAVQKNPAALKLGFEAKSMSVSRVVSAEDVTKHKIDKKFLKTVIEFQLDADAVKTALKAGQEFPWATLEQGESLRIKE